jgi:hypothetical protein
MTLIAKPAAKVNYLNNRDILKEIHLSKTPTALFGTEQLIISLT